MERVAGEIDGVELRIRDFDAFGILLFVQFGADFEAGTGGGRGDQLDDGAIAAQRPAPPVDGNEREQTMLDLVPLAGAGRQMKTVIGSLSSSASF